MLSDYNLILLCAESFDTAVIDPERTPTLYRLVNEGFVFTNYYNAFPNTTTDGEYALMQGLYPDAGRSKAVSSLYASRNSYLPFTLGNLFRQQRGITSYGYHNGHVVGMEGLFAVDVVVHGDLNHLKIRGRPVDLHIQAGIRCLKVVAHVGVGDVAVVEIADVVVIAVGLVAHSVQRVAEAEGKIVGARHIEAGIRLRAGHIRIKPHAHGVFAVGGDGLERAVVIFKENTRMAQLVERRRQLLADKPRAEALGVL